MYVKHVIKRLYDDDKLYNDDKIKNLVLELMTMKRCVEMRQKGESLGDVDLDIIVDNELDNQFLKDIM